MAIPIIRRLVPSSFNDSPVMSIFDHIKSGGFADPSTLQGASFYAIIFAFFAWLVGRTLRLAVQRVLANDKHDHFDIMAVRFVAK